MYILFLCYAGRDSLMIMNLITDAEEAAATFSNRFTSHILNIEPANGHFTILQVVNSLFNMTWRRKSIRAISSSL
jgi:hypothetical protein